MQKEEEDSKAAKPRQGGRSSKAAKKARQKASKAAAVATDRSADSAATSSSTSAASSRSKVAAPAANSMRDHSSGSHSPAALDSMREDQQASVFPAVADSTQDDPQHPQDPTLQAPAPQHQAQEAASSAAAWMLCPITKVRSTAHLCHSVYRVFKPKLHGLYSLALQSVKCATCAASQNV